MRLWTVYLATLVLVVPSLAGAQDLRLRGEAAVTVTLNDAEPRSTFIDGRYLSELTADSGLTSATLDALVAADLDAGLRIVSLDDTELDSSARLYRAWLRFASNQFESRIGRQKIAFGTATLLRPLRWFDRLDPRDPLQITEGVDALLVRYYFLNNANVWLWGLLGNRQPKGWEVLPTMNRDPEVGGRVQVPAGPGEIAASYHHRVADAASVVPAGVPGLDTAIPEHRYALDGKWDATVGLWFEVVLIHQRSDLLPQAYQRLAVMGVDYTFGLGDGLTLIGEHFIADRAQDAFGSGDGAATTALSARYRWGVLDELSAIFYYDWQQAKRYHFGSWRRTYDHLSVNLLAFTNPAVSPLAVGQPQNEMLAGTGVQVLVSFNH